MEVEKYEILRHLDLRQASELEHRRRREFQIFTGTATLLLALSAGIMLRETGRRLDEVLRDATARLLLGGMVVLLTGFSISWQLQQRKFASVNERVMTRIAVQLGCFAKNGVGGRDALFPEAWKSWGKQYKTLGQQLRRPGKLWATIGLGGVALVSIWISG